jgi:hypothetical protein
MPKDCHKTCFKCNKDFMNYGAFNRHIKLCGKGQGKWQCPFCESKYGRKDDLRCLHFAEKHPESSDEVLQGKAEPIWVAASPAPSLAYNQEDLNEFTKAMQPYLGIEAQNSPVSAHTEATASVESSKANATPADQHAEKVTPALASFNYNTAASVPYSPIRMKDPLVHEERCPHGVRLPVWIYRRKFTVTATTKSINGEVVTMCGHSPAPPEQLFEY